jgi:hypothetical protein
VGIAERRCTKLAKRSAAKTTDTTDRIVTNGAILSVDGSAVRGVGPHGIKRAIDALPSNQEVHTARLIRAVLAMEGSGLKAEVSAGTGIIEKINIDTWYCTHLPGQGTYIYVFPVF